MSLPQLDLGLMYTDMFDNLKGNIYSIKLAHKLVYEFYKIIEYSYLLQGKEQCEVVFKVLNIKTNKESYIPYRVIQEITETDLEIFK